MPSNSARISPLKLFSNCLLFYQFSPRLFNFSIVYKKKKSVFSHFFVPWNSLMSKQDGKYGGYPCLPSCINFSNHLQEFRDFNNILLQNWRFLCFWPHFDPFSLLFVPWNSLRSKQDGKCGWYPCLPSCITFSNHLQEFRGFNNIILLQNWRLCFWPPFDPFILCLGTP